MKIIAIIIALLIAMGGNTYTMSAVVTDVDADTVTVEDFNGNVWEFYGDGFAVGEILTLVMDDCGTTNITDDMIVDVK